MKHLLLLSAAFLAGGSIQAQALHTLHVLDNEFSPASLEIALGDQIHILFDDPDHTFTQVSLATWEANGSTPLVGGYNMGEGTPNPGTDFTVVPTAVGIIYYVCQFHVDMGMKGTITVIDASGIEPATMQDDFILAPVPANDHVAVMPMTGAPVIVQLYDVAGRNLLSSEVSGERTLDLNGIPAGEYSVAIRDLKGVLLSRQRLVVAH